MWEDLLDQLSVDDMINMVNLGGFQTVGVDSIGKVGTQDSDGTSGLNDWYIGVYGTAYPTELLIAQTWNKELAEKLVRLRVLSMRTAVFRNLFPGYEYSQKCIYRT